VVVVVVVQQFFRLEKVESLSLNTKHVSAEEVVVVVLLNLFLSSSYQMV